MTDVQFVAAFPDLDGVSVWLCTDSDHQRDALSRNGYERDTVVEIFHSLGFPESEEILTTAQSQETVDRDYEGSWFFAMR